jgi:O-antigen/teichoic acid export membrane protein
MVQTAAELVLVEKTRRQLPNLLPWVRKGAWSLTDQWLFSGANFLANVLLARWLIPEDYGAFSLGFSLFLLLGAFYTAVIIDPMLIFGAGRYREQLDKYLWFIFTCHVVLGLISALLLGLGAWLAQSSGAILLAQALLGVAISTPFILLAWSLRHSFYIKAEPAKASAGSAIYLIALLGGISILRLTNFLTGLSAYLMMGMASLLVAIFLVSIRKPKKPAKAEDGGFSEMWAAQWKYARWSGLTSFLIWIPLNIFLVIIPYSVGLLGTASLRALSNLITPMMQSTLALTTLVIPKLAQIYREGNKGELLRRVKPFVLFLLAASISYWVLLVIFHPQLFHLLYGGRYSSISELSLLAGFIPVAFGLSVVLESILRSMEQPKRIFQAYAAAAIVACSVGVALTLTWQLVGAIVGQILTFLVLAIVLYRQVRISP